MIFGGKLQDVSVYVCVRVSVYRGHQKVSMWMDVTVTSVGGACNISFSSNDG